MNFRNPDFFFFYTELELDWRKYPAVWTRGWVGLWTQSKTDRTVQEFIIIFSQSASEIGPNNKIQSKKTVDPNRAAQRVNTETGSSLINH